MNEQLQELLCDYLEGELSADKRKEVEELLASEPELRRTLSELQQARGALRELPAEAAPLHVRDAIKQHIEHPAPTPMFSAQKLSRIAAMLLLALGGGLVIWAMLPSNSPRQMAMETSALPAPARNAMKLETVAKELDADTLLKEDAQNYYANARAVMVIRASDVPAAEREIGGFLASNNIAYVNAPAPGAAAFAGMGGPAEPRGEVPAVTAAPVVVASTPAPTIAPAPVEEKAAADKARERTLAAKSVAGPMPSAPQTPSPALKATEKQTAPPGFAESGAAAPSERPEGYTMSAAKSAAAPSPVRSAIQGGQQLTVRNMNQDQVRFIRENVYNMADGRKMLVEHESAEITQAVASQVQAQMQLRKQVPYASQQELRSLRQEVQAAGAPLLDKTKGTSALYDLTIVVEPAQPLPAATVPATLPSSRPR